MKVQNKTHFKRHLIIWVAFVIIFSSCNTGLDISGPEETDVIDEVELSEIDQKAIKVISANSFYTANSEYIDHVVKTLARNGEYLVDAINKEYASKVKSSEIVSDLTIVDFENITKIKAKSSNDNSDLEKLSSHIKVVDQDGSYEEFELVVVPNVTDALKKGSKFKGVAETNTWLALDPDRFYIQEDVEGNSIWPVKFEAVSLEDPEKTTIITLYEDGSIDWGIELKHKTDDVNAELLYLDTIAILDPCTDCGGGSVGNNSFIDEVEFLALKKLRLHSSGDGSRAGEIQMHIDFYDDYGTEFNRDWNFVFDHKRGWNNRPLWFDDLTISGLFRQSVKLVVNPYGTLVSSATNVFSGRNTRSFALDGRIYQTPDVNYKNTNYYFENMRNWSHIQAGNIISGYAESDSRRNYFPIALLTNLHNFRIILIDDDRKYPYASALRNDKLKKDIWTFNVSNGNYNYLSTKIDANKHFIGKSDDMITRSGIRRINLNSANQNTNYGSTTLRMIKDGFEYELVKVSRSVELRPI